METPFAQVPQFVDWGYTPQPTNFYNNQNVTAGEKFDCSSEIFY
jgi:hypothetical protein